MDYLSEFLASHDPDVRISALRLLNSKFLINPAEIVLNFSYFLPAFLALLQDKSQIAYYQLTSKLIDVLTSDEFDLNPPTVNAFLQFFKACCELSPQSSTIDSFVIGMFDTSRIYSAIAFLFKRYSPSDHLEVLFGLLVVSQSLAIFEFIEPLADSFRELALSRRSEFIPDLMKCLGSPSTEICLFAANALSHMTDDDSVLLKLLPFAGLLRARLSGCQSASVSHILETLAGDPFRRRVFAQPCDLSVTPAVEMREPESRSLGAEIAEDAELLTAVDQGRKIPGWKQGTLQSLSRWLEIPMAAQIEAAGQSAPSVVDAQPEVGPTPRVAGIVAVAHKLGGFQRGAWQRRVFEYHPFSKCVVWRKGKQSPAKGFLLVGPGVTVERVVKGLKGKPYVMEISTDKPVHQIAFETQGELDKWLVTLEAARVQQ